MNTLKKTALAIAIGIFSFATATAQQTDMNSAEQVISDMYQQLMEDAESELDLVNFYDDMIFLSEHPININKATREELEKLYFLSDIQIDNILYYLYRNKSLKTIYELQLIDGIDPTDIRNILPFIKLGKAESKKQKIKPGDVFKYGKNTLLFRLDRGLETKEGYRFYPEEETDADKKNSKKYVGDPFYTSLRYRFNYRNRIAFGISAEKDAGEQFWGNQNKGYDSYSFHYEMKNFGNLKTLVLGDYRANFAQGLVMRTDFSMGKSSYVLQVNPRSTGLKKFTSTAEADFFRGVGTTMAFGNLNITAFYSNRKVDADTANGQFSTIIKDGLHRTVSDLEAKKNVRQQVVGGNISYMHNWFEIGTTIAHTTLDHTLTPKIALYNKFYFSGNKQTVGSINYRIKANKLIFFGETAISDQKDGWATINGLNYSPVSRLSLVALQRYFSKSFDTFYANTFSETSRVNNEFGVYMGVEIRPIKYWKISAYADSYRFPWIKYGIYSPSVGRDYLVQVDYAPKRNVNMYWRFKHEEKESNYTAAVSSVPVVLAKPKWAARYLLSYSFGRFGFKNQLDVNGVSDNVNNPTFGYSVLQDVSYRFAKIPLRIDLRFHLFDAKNYNNRFYTYERDVLYAFSVPMNYGAGTRYYVNLKYEMNNHISFWLKLAQTTYADERTVISSNNEEIQGNRKSDFRFLMRVKF